MGGKTVKFAAICGWNARYNREYAAYKITGTDLQSKIFLERMKHISKFVNKVVKHTKGMGQARSRDGVYVSPELTQQPIRKTGSLTSLTFGRMGKKGSTASLKRSRSFRENKGQLEQQLREKLEEEARALDKWVSERPRKYREFVVPKLVELASHKVARCLQSPMDVEGLPIHRELKDAVEFRVSPTFDQSLADNKMSFTNGGRSIQYIGKGYSTIVLKTAFDSGFKQGRHAWIIHIDSSRVQGWIQIGVVSKSRFNQGCKTNWDGNPHPYRRGEIARRNNGNFHSGRSELEATMVQETIYLGGYSVGDTVSLQLDFDLRQLQWLKNGELYGGKVPFEDEDPPVYPSVSLDSPGEGVTLAYYTGPIAL